MWWWWRRREGASERLGSRRAQQNSEPRSRRLKEALYLFSNPRIPGVDPPEVCAIMSASDRFLGTALAASAAAMAASSSAVGASGSSPAVWGESGRDVSVEQRCF